jgi:hypothetical protein
LIAYYGKEYVEISVFLFEFTKIKIYSQTKAFLGNEPKTASIHKNGI